MDIQRELTRLITWNESMTKELRHCSTTARSWIRQMIDENASVIAGLRLMLFARTSEELPSMEELMKPG